MARNLRRKREWHVLRRKHELCEKKGIAFLNLLPRTESFWNASF